MEPVLVVFVFALDDLEVFGLEQLGNRTGLAIADLTTVNRTDGSQFSCSTCEKDLVGDVEHVTGDRLFTHFVSEVACQGDDGIASQATQYAVSMRV